MEAGEDSKPIRSTLVDQVYERLMELLLDGTLKSGDPVSIDGTARYLGVSPTPVREALARLGHEGGPTPFGVFRSVERAEFARETGRQLATAVETRGPGDLGKLLRSRGTWTVN